VDWKIPTDHALPLAITRRPKPEPVDGIRGLLLKPRHLFGSIGGKVTDAPRKKRSQTDQYNGAERPDQQYGWNRPDPIREFPKVQSPVGS